MRRPDLRVGSRYGQRPDAGMAEDQEPGFRAGEFTMISNVDAP
jgi:hypothetical protein